jgi:Ca2+-binding RTX toxin-like protein
VTRGPLLRSAAVAVLLAGLPQPATGGTAKCFGHQVTIFAEQQGITEGTSGNDVIQGTGGADVIQAKGGNDRICARGGDDELLGGNGNDKLSGGGGADELGGGPDEDTVSYSESAGPIVVILNGAPDDGNPVLNGGEGEDDNVATTVENLIGSKGRDYFDADDDDNTFWGRGGEDTFLGDDGKDVVQGGDGNDAPLNGGGGADDIAGGQGKDDLFGENGNDRLIGNGGEDFADGGPNHDTCQAEDERHCEENP